MDKKEYGFTTPEEDEILLTASFDEPRPPEELPTIPELLEEHSELSDDTFEIYIGRHKLGVKFRRLSRAQVDDCEMDAERYWWRRLQENRGSGDPPLPYDHMNSLHIQARLALEKESRLLFASICKKDGSPITDNYNAFKKVLRPEQQEEIFTRWSEWFSKQPLWDDFTEEEAKEVIKEFKKKDTSKIIAYDYLTLQACLSFLANQPWMFPQDSSSDITSSKEQ